jgi:acyl-CoA reductase-like NAD-dependent aldehyde dehydrogenase
MHDLIPEGTTWTTDLLVQTTKPAAGTHEVRSPFDDALLTTVPTGGARHVEDALAVAHGLYRDRDGWLPLPERLGVLERLASMMAERHEALALLAASEGGKPLIDSRVEVTRAIDGIRLCIEAARDDRGDVISIATTAATLGRTAYTQKEPIGVVVAVSAFNHPLNLIVHQVGPAIAAGCPVIVKPAGDTPLSCLNFVQMLHDAGLPAAWCQAIVTDSNDTATALVTDSRVAFFSFIGSGRVGWMLRSRLAPGTRCALEHGGVAPAIVLDDFDVETTVAAVAKGGFYHAGQVCVSVQRVFVSANQAREFATKLAETASQLVVGDPTDEATEVGPLIRPAEVERVDEWVREAVDAGGELLTGGKRKSEHCYLPTVVLDPPADARVSTREVFGPVVCVYGYDDVRDAIEQANSLPTAFQAAVFGRDINAALDAVRRLDASAVMVNDHTAFRDDVMPFAGLRESGLGTGGIPYTLEDMQVDKMTVIRHG